MIDPQLAQVLKDLDTKQVRVLTGTVTSDTVNAQSTPVQLDNDAAGNGEVTPVIIPSICGLLTRGTRVSILTTPPANMMIVGVIGAPYNIGEMYTYLQLISNNTAFVIRRFYTADTVWPKPTSPLFMGVVVSLQAGGGGSGGTAAVSSQTACSGGGQGGGYLKGYTTAAFLDPAPATIIVGTGGAGGAAGTNNGTDGNTSWFISGGGTTEMSVAGGKGGAGGGAGPSGAGSFGQTTQQGGASNQLATVVVTNFETLDFQQGDDGGTGNRLQFGDIGLILPGYGGGSRMGAQTGVGTLVTAGGPNPPTPNYTRQIAPVAGWLFGGGASGRGVNSYSATTAILAAGGSSGADGCVIVEEIYRT